MNKVKTTEEKSDFVIWDTKPKKKERRAGARRIWIAAVGIAALLALAGGVYAQRLVHYTGRFLPGTTIQGVDVSELTAGEAAQRIDAALEMPVFEIYGRTAEESSALLGTVDGADIAFANRDTLFRVTEYLDGQDRAHWPQNVLFGEAVGHTYAPKQGYDADAFADRVLALPVIEDALREAEAYVPVEPELIYDGSEGKYVVLLGEEPGLMIDRAALGEILRTPDLVSADQPALHLEGCDIYRAADLSESEELVRAAEDANRWLLTDLTYDWNGRTVSVGREEVREWIRLSEPGGVGGVSVPELNEEAVAAFVLEQSAKYDTYGLPRNFQTTADGVVTLSNLIIYGWKTNVEATTEALLEEIRNGGTGSREPEYTSRGYVKGENDIGGSYIEINLSDQVLYLYSEGTLLFATAFVSGNIGLDCETPTGVFGIVSKSTNLYLVGPTWNDFVYFWMPFYRGYGMHDATWRTEFGGDIYLLQGSHGCINLPLESVAFLFQNVQVGYPVIVYKTRPTPPIEDPSLAFFPG